MKGRIRHIALTLIAMLIFQIIPSKVFAFDAATKDGDGKDITSEWENYTLMTTNGGGIDLSGSDISIEGDVHSDNNFNFFGSKLSIDGLCEAYKFVHNQGALIEVKETKENAEKLKVPDIVDQIINKDKEKIEYDTEKVLNNNDVNKERNIYTSKYLEVRDKEVKFQSSIISDKNINLNASKITKSESDDLVFIVSKEGNIEINSNDVDMKGVLYAPNGTITINSSKFNFEGKIIAKNVIYRGSLMKLTDIKSIPNQGEHTVTFNLNYDGENNILDRLKVKDGEYAIAPKDPERGDYLLLGWYKDKNYTEYFDFDSMKITEDITLYARWVNFNDEVDTDGDGLTDSLEEVIGTNKNKVDTDGDGLSDFIEIDVLGLDPLKADTDSNGINDGDEDNDSDGLTNLKEVNLGTSPILKDTDKDGLTDYEEVVKYGTDPLKIDTDGDIVSDGREIEIGTDPLVAQTSFNMNVVSDDEDSVKASVQINLAGKQVETLTVDKVENETLFPKDIPGYIGGAYDFNVEGSFDSANISFEFNTNLLNDEGFDPVVYYFNEEKQELEPLQTTVNGNVASASVNHFSTYILVNRVVFEKAFMWMDVWDTNNYTGVEVVLVIDDSGSMTSNDRYNNRLNVAENLIDNLPLNSKIGVVKFTDYTTKLTTALTSDKDLAKSYVTNKYFKSSGGTSMYTAIDDSFSLFKTNESSILKMMVVLTDGATSDIVKHDDIVGKANSNSVKLYTVGLGGSTGYFEDYLEPLAVNTGAKFYLASNSSDLNDIYKDINTKIDIETDSDGDGISDYYEDNMVIFNGVKIKLDKYNPDTDGDGLLDGEEVADLKYFYNEDKTKVIVIGSLKSNPASKDSDNDGLYDNEARMVNGRKAAPKDPEPLRVNGPMGIWDSHVEQLGKDRLNPTEYSSDASGIEATLPKNVSDSLVKIALKLRDPANQNAKWIRKVALFIKYFCKGDLAAAAGAYILNFRYDEYDIAYHSKADTWQRSFGYNDFYDDVFRIGSYMKFEKFEFKSNNDKHVLWAWKGDYWNLRSGAEIGLYNNPTFVSGSEHWDTIDFELPMTLSLYNYYSPNNIENVFSWLPSEKQWWVTGFNPKFKNPDPEVMVSVGSIDFTGHEDLYNGIKETKINVENNINNEDYDIYKNNIIIDEDGHTVWVAW